MKTSSQIRSWSRCGLVCLASTFAASATAHAQAAPAAQARLDPVRAEQLYLQGARQVDSGDLPAAQANFAQAQLLDPARAEYGEAFEMARAGRVSTLIQRAARARMTGDPAQAAALLQQARKLDPESDLVKQHAEDGSGVPSGQAPGVQPVAANDLNFAGPLEVQPQAGVHDFDLRGDARQAVQQVAQAFGLKTVLDESVTAGPSIRFTVTNSDFVDTWRVLLRMNHLFSVVLDSKTLLVIKDTQENRQKFERQLEETIFLPGSTPEQLNEVQNIVKNVFDVNKVSVQANSSALLVRAPQATLKAVNYTLADLIDGGSQVVLEVKLVSVDKTRTVNTGFSPPSSITAFSVAAEAQSLVTANQSILNTAIQQGLFTPAGSPAEILVEEAAFLVLSGAVQDANFTGFIGTFGHGLTLGGVALGSGATVNLGLNTSDARALEDVTIRAGDRQTSTLRIGSKYPITTSTYSSGISASTASALAGVTVGGVSASSLLSQYLGNSSTATIPQIQYEDLGLTLKTTPSVQKNGMVTLQIDMKIEALTGASANNIPVLTSRVFTSTITVPDGSSALLLSELSKTESKSVGGLPGLGSLPGFQSTLADTDREHDSSELVLTITPHIVRKRPGELAGPRIAFQTSTPQEF